MTISRQNAYNNSRIVTPMAKKKRSMLDSARETVVSMLGDFPAGFNAGATAGMLGWPGDMAMMADTAWP